MRNGWMVLVLAFGSTGVAQITNYLGPGILSRGAGDVGARAGQQADVRISGSVSGIVDTGLVPLSVDVNGAIPNVGRAYGVEASLSAYGTHRWKRAQLGLSYQGTYRYYTENTFFNGSDQALILGYTVQPSRRVIVDMRGTGGTFSYGNNGFYGYDTESFNPNTSLLFDNRSDFYQGSMDFTFVKSPRTSFTAGGYGFSVHRRAKQLVGVNGYALRGSMNHRVSRETTIGISFDHSHYDYPRAFGEADINSLSAVWARSLGAHWTVNVTGGAYLLEVQGLQSVAIDPAIAAILGTYTSVQAFYRRSTFPMGSVGLTRRFKTGVLALHYERKINTGNGVYLTSRTETGYVSYSYTGIKKWSFSANGGYATYSSIGQNLSQYRGLTGSAGMTYALTGAIHVLARYDARQQQIDATNGLSRVSYRATIGLAFSPGNIPLSLW